MGRRAALITLLVTLAFAWGSLALVLATGTTPKLGLDLQGGFSVVLEAPEGTDSGVLEKAVEIMTRRIEALGGVQEPVLKIVDDRNIQVELPGVTDRDRARAAVGTTGQLEFRPVITYSSVGVSPLVLEAQQQRLTAQQLEDTLTGETTTTTAAGGDTTTTSSSTTTTVPEEPLDLATVLPDGAVLCTLDAAGEVAAGSEIGCVHPVTGLSVGDDPLQEAWLVQPTSGYVYHVAPACSRADWLADTCTDHRIDPDAPEGVEKALLGADLTDSQKLYRSSGGGTGPLGVSGGGTGEWVVQLEFSSAGADKFETVTSELTQFAYGDPQRQFAIVLDGEVISAPSMSQEFAAGEGISGGSAIITLGASTDPEQEADDLAVVLRYGALPVSFVESTSQEVSATLGSDSLSAGLVAGIGGLALVALAMILYYRFLGFVNVIGLTVFGSLVYVAFGVLGATSGVTLTLAGVAGVIVSVGITSDSYIVYFERIKEEVHKGRSLKSAIDHAFSRAFRTILTADTVSFFAAGLLYFLAIGSVKGFALALGIATVTDVAVAYFFTRPAVSLVARTRFGEGGRFSIRGATGAATAKEVAQ
ncbi:MAG: protein translocase subunit SecD [Actinobacteria bacterium]|nr:protein translocase subunit SecD [Actinomycetota bacterium]